MKSVIAENLVKTYRNGEVKALNGLSLDVEEQVAPQTVTQRHLLDYQPQ